MTEPDTDILTDELETLMPVLQAIPDEDVSRPTMPVGHLPEEANLLLVTAREDKEALLAIRLDGSKRIGTGPTSI